jgi:hypothetical protein
MQGEQADPDGTESDTADISTVDPVYQVQEIGYQPHVIAHGFPSLVREGIRDEELFFVGAQASTTSTHQTETVAFY